MVAAAADPGWIKLLLPAVVQIAGIMVATGWAVTQFRRTSRAERQKPLREEQLRLAVRITTACATLASTDNADAFVAARREFWVLYYGPLILVEDGVLEAAMVRFGHDLGEARLDSARDGLKAEALRLASATRSLIEKSWDIDLGQLKNIRKEAA